MLRVVCFLWRNTKAGIVLPAQELLSYTERHVNVLYSMLRRHLKIPFEMVCITDQPGRPFHSEIRVIPLWDKCRYLGGCFNRLYVFSKDMAELIGPRFVCIDIDCVIVGDLTPMLSRREDFIINAYVPSRQTKHRQRFNGGMFMMDAGSRSWVWDSFDARLSPRAVKHANDSGLVAGTDQAWIDMVLHGNEARFTAADGVYEAREHRVPPVGARLMMFSGRRDPSLSKEQWVKRNWQ